MSLHLVPVTFAQAARFVGVWHRHLRPPAGHKFSTCVADGDLLVGVAMVGRPVSRFLDDGFTLEVNRTATDGSRNANSMLYAACWQVAKGLGYTRLMTYNRADESGSSLRAAGWQIVAERPSRGGWSTPSRPRGESAGADTARTLWEAPNG